MSSALAHILTEPSACLQRKITFLKEKCPLQKLAHREVVSATILNFKWRTCLIFETFKLSSLLFFYGNSHSELQSSKAFMWSRGCFETVPTGHLRACGYGSRLFLQFLPVMVLYLGFSILYWFRKFPERYNCGKHEFHVPKAVPLWLLSHWTF